MSSPTRQDIEDAWDAYEKSPEYGDEFYKDTKLFMLYSIAYSLKNLSEKT